MIDPTLKIKEIERSTFRLQLEEFIFSLQRDTGYRCDNIQYTAERLCYFIYDLNKFPGLNFGNIIKVFEEMSSGIKEIKRICVTSICSCISEFHKEWKERNRFELQAYEERIEQEFNGIDILKGIATPDIARSIRWKVQNLSKDDWDLFSISEIIEKGLHMQIKEQPRKIFKKKY